MGLCESCFGSGGVTPTGAVGVREYANATRVHAQPEPDPEEKRRHLAEAAEKRRQEQEGRGVQHPESGSRLQRRADEIAKQEALAAQRGQPVLKWQMA